MLVRSKASREDTTKCLVCDAEFPACQQEPSKNGHCPYCRRTLQCDVKMREGIMLIHLNHNGSESSHDFSGLWGSLDPTDGARFLIVDLEEMLCVTSSMLALLSL